MTPKSRKPEALKGKEIQADCTSPFMVHQIYLAVGPFSNAVTIKEAKRLHNWLGRAIEYLESKK